VDAVKTVRLKPDTTFALDAIGECRSAAMRQLHELAATVGPSTSRVLITGEAGVGKELLARYLHGRSTRSREPFVTLDCAAGPAAAASELFGEGLGSRFRPGKLREADRGTLFLDEVSALDLPTQGGLLRWLEHGEFPSSRGAADGVDVRVLASTRRDLRLLARAGHFRADLLMRLKPVEIHVPPLRQRWEDIRPLVSHLLAKSSRPIRFSDELLDALERYGWPGNVRELTAVVEQIAWKVTGDVAGINDLPRQYRPDAISLLRAGDRRRHMADDLFDALVEGRLTFWDHVRSLFLNRELTRNDLRHLVRRGLEATRGSYRDLLPLFGMAPGDYKRFLNFLATHDCTVDSREYRTRRQADGLSLSA
jgi:DNA-binding NtrC family response regulator